MEKDKCEVYREKPPRQAVPAAPSTPLQSQVMFLLRSPKLQLHKHDEPGSLLLQQHMVVGG